MSTEWEQYAEQAIAVIAKVEGQPVGDGYDLAHKAWVKEITHMARGVVATVGPLIAESVRKQVAEEIAKELDGNAAMWATPSNPPEEWDSHHLIVRNAHQIALKNAAKTAREIGGLS